MSKLKQNIFLIFNYGYDSLHLTKFWIFFIQAQHSHGYNLVYLPHYMALYVLSIFGISK